MKLKECKCIDFRDCWGCPLRSLNLDCGEDILATLEEVLIGAKSNKLECECYLSEDMERLENLFMDMTIETSDDIEYDMSPAVIYFGAMFKGAKLEFLFYPNKECEVIQTLVQPIHAFNSEGKLSDTFVETIRDTYTLLEVIRMKTTQYIERFKKGGLDYAYEIS